MMVVPIVMVCGERKGSDDKVFFESRAAELLPPTKVQVSFIVPS